MTNFEGLSSYDFELLVRDLLSAEWGLRLESFAPGRDEGVDVRHLGTKTRGDSPATVIQCKHYERSGFAKLKSALAADARKVVAKTAKRYVLATTVAMTPRRKQQLVAEVPCLLKSEADVFGREDIESLVRNHPEVERAHFKLWLNSTAVLERVLHSDIPARTEDYVSRLHSRAALFVQNASVDDARNLLESEHVCVIAGPPGVGKSTLADILLMIYLADGYEPFLISEDIGEADAMYRKDAKQLFLYDDFLGRTSSLEKLGKNEDQRLVNFMRRVSRAGHKRFVLTTRQYILEQAKRDYERLSSDDVEVARYFLDVGKYTIGHRGHIIYNHLYFSTLPNAHLEALVASRTYRTLANNRNFNPRLVETAIQLAVREAVSAEELGPFLVHAFNNPVELWRHVMRNQLTLEQRTVLALLALEGKSIDLDRLEGMYVTLAASNASTFAQPFSTCLSGLEGLTLSLKGTTSTSAELSNPGVQDAVINHILPQPAVLSLLSQAVDSLHHIAALWNYANEVERSSSHEWMWTRPKGGGLLVERSSSCLRPALQKAVDATLLEFVKRAVAIRDRRSWRGSSFEDAFLLMTQLSAPLDAPSVEDSVRAFMSDMAAFYHTGDGCKEKALQVALAMTTSAQLPQDLRSKVMAAAVERVLTGDNSSLTDFQTLLDLREAVDAGEFVGHASLVDRCPDAEDVRRELDSFMPRYLGRLDDGEGLVNARSTLEDWEGLLRELGRSIDHYDSEVWTELERAEAEEYEPEYDRDEFADDDDEMEDLDELFGSLTDR